MQSFQYIEKDSGNRRFQYFDTPALRGKRKANAGFLIAGGGGRDGAGAGADLRLGHGVFFDELLGDPIGSGLREPAQLDLDRRSGDLSSTRRACACVSEGRGFVGGLLSGEGVAVESRMSGADDAEGQVRPSQEGVGQDFEFDGVVGDRARGAGHELEGAVVNPRFAAEHRGDEIKRGGQHALDGFVDGAVDEALYRNCLLYTSPSPRDA